MELNDFIAKFADLFEDIDSQEITAETYFHELDEWSSIMAVSIIAMINDEFNIVIDGRTLRQADTVEDLYNCVKKTLNK